MTETIHHRMATTATHFKFQAKRRLRLATPIQSNHSIDVRLMKLLAALFVTILMAVAVQLS